MKIKLNALGVKVVHGRHQVLERAIKAINAPHSDPVEVTTRCKFTDITVTSEVRFQSPTCFKTVNFMAWPTAVPPHLARSEDVIDSSRSYPELSRDVSDGVVL